MSRFTDTLERDLKVIADRATPSPDAWAQIQSRIDDQEPIQETEIIMLTENTLTKRRWPLVAAAAAVAALAIGAIALVNRDDGAEQPADVPTPTVAPAPDPESGADEQQGSATDVSPLPAEGAALAPGRYAPFTLGLPVTFEVPADTASPWTVQVSNPVTINVGNADGFVVLTRVGSLYDAEQAQTPGMTGLGSIPPDDIDGWIEANDAVVVDSREETIGGRTARFRQVTAPPGAGDATESCPAEQRPCLSVGSASADLQDTYDGVSMAVFGENAHSFWFVELDDFEPLAIWSSAVGAGADAWLAEAMPMIESIELGDPAPAVEFGSARLSTFGQDAAGDGELPEAGEQVAPGTYSTDAIGTPVTVDIQDGQTGPWTLVSNDQNGIQLISDDTGREFIAIGRVGSWFDAAESRTEGTRGLGSIPADGMDTWIAANDVIVVDSAEVQVGGRDASYRLIRLDTTPGATADFCPPSEAPCLWAASGSADLVDDESTPVPFGRDRLQAVWSIDMGEFEPVFIFAAANLDDDGPWFTDTVQPIVDSIVFDEPAPAVEGGTARVPEQFTATGAFDGARTTGEPLADGSVPVDSTITMAGDVAGEITGVGTAITVEAGIQEEGSDEFTFTGTIDGVGTGTVTYTLDWQLVGGVYSSAGLITGGTADFAGATGTTTTSIQAIGQDGENATSTGTITFFLGLPRSG